MNPPRYHYLKGDSETLLPALPANVFHAMVTDPPGGIGFMGREWDSPKGGREKWVDWLSRVMAQALRTLRPGAHALVWAIPRTSHWTGTALEMAGFEVRDRIHHVYGSGMQHARNASKAIDYALVGKEIADAARPIVGTYRVGGNALTPTAEKGGTFGVAMPNAPSGELTRTTGLTPQAQAFDGYYSNIAPGCEDWWLVRKPIEGDLAANLLKWGTGALNVDRTRVKRNWDERGEAWKRSGKTQKPDAAKIAAPPGQGMILHPEGSVPKNLVLTHSEACEIDAQPEGCADDCPVADLPGDTARYFNVFYCQKASRNERNHGCGALPTKTGGEATGRVDGSAGVNRPQAGAGRTGGARNFHPTVKPRTLMEFLCALACPAGGIILDPFTGSGSTGVAAIALGLEFFGIELGGENGEYFPIIDARLAQAVRDMMEAA